MGSSGIRWGYWIVVYWNEGHINMMIGSSSEPRSGSLWKMRFL